MNEKQLQPKHLLSLSEEYRRLISLPAFSEDDAERMAEILEIANSNEDLNCLIEEVEMNNYIGSQKAKNHNQGLQRLLQAISESTSDSSEVSALNKVITLNKANILRQTPTLVEAILQLVIICLFPQGLMFILPILSLLLKYNKGYRKTVLGKASSGE
ncbi:MAG: hypothetical protein F6K25_20810 [Okeania sp. SIO2G4]|uniref:hypothetical protein n=1 Tax=unclassified Okeania TaxID=2634635 RepID=UPI0013B6EA49|nr:MULTISPECIES: hypothetical protein [unclassified Okeania]NEP39378.1 hypothetical protein [Okeania sp. SIO2H7]NEP72578.1 hypothetical protein [Okeania sp. SIO2G5]NEP95397.1 hypothetical protein [Okeania sp. SIO2F5]NEQ92974.1 hypothetical protein [Okeania sp. SIO2G4]